MEIERKFLTKKLPMDLNDYEKHEIEQGYISTNPTIRLRKSDDRFFLTVKGGGAMVHVEYELELSESQFRTLWQKVETNTVEKTRYIVPLSNGLFAEVDIYKGVLHGLMTTEVEFSTVEEANSFVPPEWFGDDVTLNKHYSNSSLAKHGLPT